MEIGQKEKKCIYGCKVVYKQNRYIKNENSTFTLIIDTKQHINFKHIESDMSSVSPDHNGKIRGKKGNISFIIYLKVSSFFYSKMSSIILSSIWTFIFFMVLNTFEESFAVSSWKWQKTKSLKRSFVNLDRFFFFHVFILFKYFPKIIWFFFFLSFILQEEITQHPMQRLHWLLFPLWLLLSSLHFVQCLVCLSKVMSAVKFHVVIAEQFYV